ncbi:hypothetical protein [Yinghuangia seranimata]|uniref:hypothetical protein n=1 Tax=Yinghuangia seranimata TaxID=408067 RepID=UPI00248C9131|nr:hypothetical protein [Yinghuangia seranimata]MDI2124631.1 hypothetical protein [Yinghuangia seranimata]
MSYEITVITPDDEPPAGPVLADADTVRVLLDEAAAHGRRLRISPRRRPAAPADELPATAQENTDA